RTARRSDQNRAHRHQRRRPPSISFLVALRYRLTALSELTAVSCQLIGRIFQMMFSRDQVLALMRERVHHPAGMRELLQVLKVPKDDQTSFKRHVKSLVSSGELIQIRGNRFGLPEKMDLYVGRLQTNPAGYGFVTPERPLEPSGGDIYIPNQAMEEAMHGDRVVVRIERIKDGGRAEGRIIRI